MKQMHQYNLCLKLFESNSHTLFKVKWIKINVMQDGSVETIVACVCKGLIEWNESKKRWMHTLFHLTTIFTIGMMKSCKDIQHQEGEDKVHKDVTWKIKVVFELSTQPQDHTKGSWT